MAVPLFFLDWDSLTVIPPLPLDQRVTMKCTVY